MSNHIAVGDHLYTYRVNPAANKPIAVRTWTVRVVRDDTVNAQCDKNRAGVWVRRALIGTGHQVRWHTTKLSALQRGMETLLKDDANAVRERIAARAAVCHGRQQIRKEKGELA